MKPIACVTVFLCLALCGRTATGHDAQPTHCAPAETAFSCATARGRVLALCSAADKSVLYRFGRIGAIELQYPPSTQPQAGPMLYSEYGRYQTDRVEVRFDHQGTEYTVFDYHENGQRRAGVRITSTDTKEREIACTSPITGRLGALKNLLPCDADSALNLGTCK
ncbi:hypothetical protein [Pseudorhodoferax sp.]|uniref:hypothetical protein n=1 Tax=Pseudorhodoferax sp. TaxID=1993553 RepID=UPI0039E2EB59